jgi:hypothetical protein
MPVIYQLVPVPLNVTQRCVGTVTGRAGFKAALKSFVIIP